MKLPRQILNALHDSFVTKTWLKVLLSLFNFSEEKGQQTWESIHLQNNWPPCLRNYLLQIYIASRI